MAETKTSSTAKRRPGALLVAGTVGVLMLIVAYGVLAQKPSLEGREAPDFTLSLYGGADLALATLRGRVVVLNFWATWCAPCRAEAPALENVWRAYETRGVAFVGVNVRDVPEKAQEFLSQTDITYPNGPDPYSRIWKAYQLTAVPETFLIDQQGRVVKRYIGAISEAELKEALEGLLP